MKTRRFLTSAALVAILLLNSFLFSNVKATDSFDWSKPRPSHDVAYNGTIGKAIDDDVCAIAMGIGNITYCDTRDDLQFSVSVSANSREWIEYEWDYPLHGYYWCEATHPTNLTQDNCGVWLDLSFNFLFYGIVYNRIWVCSNGFLCLDSEYTSPSSQTFPDIQAPNSVISVFWRDLHPELGGSITYEEDVYFDNGYFLVVSWNDVPDNDGNPQTFQVLIESRMSGRPQELHNLIYFQYRSITKNRATEIGIEDQLGLRSGSVDLSEIFNGFSFDFEVVSKFGYRLDRLVLKLTKNDANACVDLRDSHTDGHNVILKNPEPDPAAIVFKNIIGFAADTILGLAMAKMTLKTVIMVGAIIVTGETAGELADELSLADFESDLGAGPGESEAYISSACVIEGMSPDWNKPFDSTLATTVLWEFLGDHNIDHTIAVTAEAWYVNIRSGDVGVLTETATLNMRAARHLNVEARMTAGGSLSGIGVSIDGRQYYSPVAVDVAEGTHTVQAQSVKELPNNWFFVFHHWNDGSTQCSRTINADDDMALVAYYMHVQCPTLFVWNGSEFVYEQLLNIHAASDITLQHQIEQPLVLDGAFYKLQLRELDNYTSHIDQVKLYAVDKDGEWHTCPLVVAKLNGTYVTYTVRFDDDARVDLYPDQIIDLKFLPSIPQHETSHFVFEINGYNKKME